MAHSRGLGKERGGVEELPPWTGWEALSGWVKVPEEVLLAQGAGGSRVTDKDRETMYLGRCPS